MNVEVQHIRELMSRIPTYMTLDDHEIEDGWPADATAKDLVIKYPAAIHAYQTYQSSHNPLLPMAGDKHLVGVPDEEVRRVVFLAGDYHFSMKSEAISPGKPDFKVLSLISSAFFWPYPQGNWRGYQVSGPLGAMSDHDYEMVNSSAAFDTDNFTRVTVDLEQLKVETFSRKGDPLYATEYTF